MLIRDQEISVLLDDFIDLYGYDFTEYSKASLRRRIERIMMMDKYLGFEEFRYRLKKDRDYKKNIISNSFLGFLIKIRTTAL